MMGIEVQSEATMYWNFITATNDIGFSVKKLTSSGKQEICGYFKYEAEKRHENHVIVPKGKYELVWYSLKKRLS